MLVSPLEIGQPNIEAAVARIAALEEYQQAFQQVFGRSPRPRRADRGQHGNGAALLALRGAPYRPGYEMHVYRRRCRSP